MAKLEVGEEAPAFRARGTDGADVDLAAYRGRWVVLYFYPKAFTPGCTREAKRFRDNLPELKALGAEVVGVSVDDLETQCAFSEEHRLGFPLVADRDGAVSRLYGAKRALLPLDRRVTYVIDPGGRIAARFEHEFQVSRHLDDVVGFLSKKRAS